MPYVEHPSDAPINRDMPPCAANYEALSPLSFLNRSAQVYAQMPALVYGELTWTWAETARRSRRMASSLVNTGVMPGDVVSVLAANTPELYLAHFGVPLAGAVLNALNTRLEPSTLAYILSHAQSTVIVYDSAFREQMVEALSLMEGTRPVVIECHDPNTGPRPALLENSLDFQHWLENGDPEFEGYMPADEWQAISLNYTSGTTGKPKGVVYSHRGAQQLALGNVLAWDMAHHPVYLWTLPMFHCNGWCFPWTLAAVGGLSVCLREVRAAPIIDALHRHGVTHLCGAPFVLDLLARSFESGQMRANPKPSDQPRRESIRVMTAAAPPTASTLAAVENAGFAVTHVYGLTEIYGPAVVCSWLPDWDLLPPQQRVALKARQGVAYHVQAGLMVADPETMAAVPWDGETLGEVMTRGNATMKGYLANPEATAEAFAGGWFHTGDLGVCHPDGYIQLKDRAKDIIISGGENISSIEVEDALSAHPAVALAAVVAMPSEKWGERPCAFVELLEGQQVDESALISHCRSLLAGFKCPDRVLLGEIPKTATGKVQKFQLREQLKAQQIDASSV